MLSRLRDTGSGCRCTPRFEGDRLVVESDGCSGGGRLSEESACLRTVVEALESRDVDSVITRAAGVERAYDNEAAALLVAAGRFADAAVFHDDTLADRTRADPIGAARTAAGRGDPLARLAAETGLAAFVNADQRSVLRPSSGPTLARARIRKRPPSNATLRERETLDTGAVVRLYDTPNDLATYHLVPAEHEFDDDATEALADAYDLLARGVIDGGSRAPSRAVRTAADDDAPVAALVSTLEKYTHGLGVLEDCFADPAVSDVFATAPVSENHLRLRRNGETFRTNVRLTNDGAAALASRFRRASGRAFSRASPTLDATADAGGRRIRIAGLTEPVSDGIGFTFRAHDESSFRLSDLVANGTLSADAAGFLSVVAERGASVLLAGPRGAGKTTLLGALLWELPVAVRTVVIEDTAELPVEELQASGRDVQPLRVTTGDGESIAPSDALRTALRLGDGALVVGEVRGDEARVLYEAMRVGAADGAVLGTIHGEGGESVRERVVTDLGVPETAFADTDLIVTLEAYERGDGRTRRVQRVEEVERVADGVGFRTLFDGNSLSLTDSRTLTSLGNSTETAADVRADVAERTAALAEGECRL